MAVLEGFDENGILRGVKVTSDGKLLVEGVEESGSGSGSSTTINNTSENPVPVSVQSETETTLASNVATVGTTAQTISIEKKVTEISIANYSETASVTLAIGNTNYVIGSNMAIDLPINNTLTGFDLSSTEADTKVQYVIKGVDA